MVVNYVDDLALLGNTPAQAKILLHSLLQAAGAISLHGNTDKTEYMCFNLEGATLTLNGGSLKFIDKFSYLGSSVSSTESDANRCQAKAWTAIDRLLTIWKSDLSDEIKLDWQNAMQNQFLCKVQLFELIFPSVRLVDLTKLKKKTESTQLFTHSWGRRDVFLFIFRALVRSEIQATSSKFELESPIPIPTTITITLRMVPHIYTLTWYIYIYIYIYNENFSNIYCYIKIFILNLWKL